MVVHIGSRGSPRGASRRSSASPGTVSTLPLRPVRRRSAGRGRVATTKLDTGTHVVSVLGDIDFGTLPAFEQALLAVADDRIGAVIVDLTGCGFFDSSGLRVLLDVRDCLERADRQLTIVLSKSRVLRVFEIAPVEGLFEIHPSVRAARRLPAPARDRSAFVVVKGGRDA